MPSSLTVAQARAATWMQVDTNPDTGPTSPLYLPYLNQVSERCINSGYWKGLCSVFDFGSAEKYITLPRRFETIVGYTLCSCPGPLYARMNEFQSGGPGEYYHLDHRLGLLVDQGEFPTYEVQESIGNIRLTANNSDDYGKVVRLYGNDADGNPIFTEGNLGVDLTLGAGPVTTSQEMWLTSVDKPITARHVTLAVVVSGTPTTLSSYEPTETNPLYRRYKSGTIEERSDGRPVIRALCKRRFVPMVTETDLVYPSSLAAIKFGLIAVKLEEQGAYELERAEQNWAKCFQVLDDELKQQRGGIRRTVNFIRYEGAAPTTH
jgi:hypothetical protein